MKTLLTIMLSLKTICKGLILTLLAFFAPIQGLLLSVGLFIFFDTIMAYWRTKKTKEVFTSRKLRKGLLGKFIPYQSAVILFYIMDFYILNEFTTHFISIQYLLTKVLALVLIYTELVSIDESWNIVKGKGLVQSFKDMTKFGRELKEDIKGIQD